MSETKVSSCLEQNLHALEPIYPGLARALQALPIPDKFPASLPPAGPVHLDESCDIHLVYRFGSNELAHRLFDKINLAEIREERNRRLLLIEDRPDAMKSFLAIKDRRVLIQSNLCLFLLLPSLLSDLQRFLQKNPEVAYGRLQIHLADSEYPYENVQRIEALFQQAKQGMEQKQKNIKVQYQHKGLPPYPNSIRFINAGHNFLQDRAVQAFKDLGYGANRLRWKNPLFRFIRSAGWLHEAANSKPDTFVFLNTTPYRFTGNIFLSRLPINKISWFVDNPRRYVSQPYELEGCDIIGVFDRTYIPYLRNLTNKPIFEVRTAFGIDPSKIFANTTHPIDIAFVGELGTRGFLSLEKVFYKVNPSIIQAADALIKEMDITQPFDFSETAEKAFANLDMPYRGVLTEYLENKTTTLGRRYFLEGLINRGLTIFGDDEWGQVEYAGPLTTCYAGKRIDYFNELPSLYANTRININIFHTQCINAPNPRVYDVLACGGFLLTSYNPGLEDEFEFDQELVVFHTRDELIAKADYYLNHDDERQQIARNGQAKALAKCGYHDRMQIFLTALTAEKGDRYVYLC